MQDETVLFTLFEMTPDLVCIVSKEGYFKKINKAVSQKLQYSQDELMARSVYSFIHPDDLDRTANARNQLLRGEPLLNFRNRYLTKNGNTIWLEWTSVYLPEKELIFAIAKDITVRHLAEQEVEENARKFKELATHFKNYNEEDRKHLAAELHEDLAQLATSIKLKIDWLADNTATFPSNLAGVLLHTQKGVDLLISKIRKLSYTFCPANITTLGLHASLQMLCTDFAAITGIACRYKSHLREDGLTHEVRLDIYRICQETLQNVGRHNLATEVVVWLRRTRKGVHLSITDNGKGFDTTTAFFGFTAMQERAISINGKLNIKSNNTGTTVDLLVNNNTPATAETRSL
jgi:PAS domain S-box-containing protein